MWKEVSFLHEMYWYDLPSQILIQTFFHKFHSHHFFRCYFVFHNFLFWLKFYGFWSRRLNWVNIFIRIQNSWKNSQPKVCSVEKETKLNQVFCVIKSSKIIFIFLPEFYLIIWLMTSPKNFEKIPILKTWQQIFFWGIKTYFGKMMLFQAWKNRYFNQNMS